MMVVGGGGGGVGGLVAVGSRDPASLATAELPLDGRAPMFPTSPSVVVAAIPATAIREAAAACLRRWERRPSGTSVVRFMLRLGRLALGGAVISRLRTVGLVIVIVVGPRRLRRLRLRGNTFR
jgi:hypothetical protein